MQLKKIKLSGFKSFVDPTTVLVPSNLVAIVGPNGCGKSNIIDAVCWVMGENSAKYLRGESLADVIFNGSNTRKPIGQASVELLFDNNDASLAGEYASYAEISIRRVLARDGDSTYYLNGTRCRRRDILDIFLGTGLGPRSYSIIGQNMISRIIDAKPDEMRVYLEEAAGISKYKERRRETENRINHTKENLARLNDIRVELDKQLGSLKRQATAAEKFNTLKEQERTVRAQFYAVQWRSLDAHSVDSTLQIKQQETGLEACQAELTQIDLNLENRRSDQRQASEIYQEVQRRYYSAGNEITRLEQEIRHTEERQQKLQHDIEQIDQDWQQIKNDLEQSEEESQELMQEIVEIEPKWQSSQKSAIEMKALVAEAEESVQGWQDNWDSFNQRISQATQTAQVEQTRIQHLEQRLASLKQRQMKLAAEQEQIDFSRLAHEQEELSKEAQMASLQTQQQDEILTETRETIASLQTSQHDLSNRLNQLRNQLQRSRGEQASLQALQQTALGQRDHRTAEWLSKHHLDQLPRLAQGIEVEGGWELAVERVLDSYLQAVCVDDIKTAAAQIAELKEGNLCLFVSKQNSRSHASKGASLLSKVKSDLPINSLLAGIYIAESLDEAIELSQTLSPEESVITQDGIWLSFNWLKVAREKNPEAGVFQREQELKKINQQITQWAEEEAELEEQLKSAREQLTELEKRREELQKIANDYRAKTAQIIAQQKVKQDGLAELKKRAELFSKEQEETASQHAQTESELQQARHIWQEALQQLEQDTEEKTILLKNRDELRDKLQQSREKLSQLQQSAQSFEIRFQTAKSQQASLQQNANRLQSQLTILSDRKAALEKDYEGIQSTEHLQEVLSSALNGRLQIEEELQAKRATVEALEQEFRTFENRRQEVERAVSKFRDRLEALRMEWQGLQVKSENILENMKATHCVLEDILKQIPEEATVDALQAELEQIEQRITRLGPINLVAIEEYSVCSERKQYLDSQNDDLQQGLNTLEDAIAKIDRETRARFKETFDKVNECFHELFPKIFGGGKASLEMTTDNLLDSGITVMACPPGKRNSTIHLLSGGEKAMTAIALVFSIFHLNPAPFCMLDEVDAPLDDLNVGRYCELVKSMAEKTQFIFISHNKLAIEMGQHLIGVTMNEPGVSRLVSVNIEEAIQMSGV